MAAELYYDWFIDKGRVYFRTTDVNVYQPGDYQKWNMEKIYNFFSGYGWTLNAISGMLGNIMVESGVNPGCCQYASIDWDNPSTIQATSGGIGLTQWTPARKYYNWAVANNLDPVQGDSQCKRIEWERENNQQWSLDNLGRHTWEDFVTSTESPETLARVFVWAYERPANPNIEQRQRNARWVYDYLSNISPTPPEPPEPQEGWVSGEYFAELALDYDPDRTGIDIPYSQLDCIGFVNKVWRDILYVGSNNWNLTNGTNSIWRSTRTFNTISPKNQNPCPELWYKNTIENCINEYGEIPPGALLFHKIPDAGPPPIPPQYAGDGIGNFAHVGIYIGNDMVMQSGGQDASSVPGGGVHRSYYDPSAWNYAAFVAYVDCTNFEPEPDPDPDPQFHVLQVIEFWYTNKQKGSVKNVKQSV
ncbi:MAG: hypothetical protein J6R06_08335 [Bacteroidales bacterium]|nr:hypothetical protein [Bacteroidales bacterium]